MLSTTPTLARAALAAALAATAAAIVARWRRRRRWLAAARRYPQELLTDAHIQRSLVPYPSAATATTLARLTGLATRKVRKTARGARAGRCARPWNGEASATSRRGSFAKRRHYYFMFHKPLGCVTQRDASGRATTVFDLLPDGFPELGPVGRLDKDTTGLLLFTDDGAVSKRLISAGTTTKAYVLDVAGVPAGVAGERALLSLAEPLDDVTLHTRERVRTAPAEVSIEARRAATATLAVVIAEGRNRQVRRLAERAGLSVTALHRDRVGPLELGDLPVGAARPLARTEVDALLRAAGLAGERGPPRDLPVAAAPELRAADVDAALEDLAKRRGF